ncbi:MAG: sigma-70 family RNA polymerase sigma factor [Anaeromyxobacter sp.]
MDTQELDSEITRLLAAGDRDAAATFALRGFGPRILAYLHTVLRDEGDATEAFGEFAEKLWKGLDSFRGESSFRVWAFRMAWNTALDLRKQAWNRRVRRMVTGEASRIAEEVRNATVLRREQQRQGLEKLREELSAEDQALLTLRIDQELSWAEIAQVLEPEGAPDPATLRKRFERLKLRLAERARELGLIE